MIVDKNVLNSLEHFKGKLQSCFDEALFFFKHFEHFGDVCDPHITSICKNLVKNVESENVSTEILQLYVDHIEYLKYGIRPVEYAIPERYMIINFLRAIQTGIKRLIERRNSAKSQLIIVDDPLNTEAEEKQSDFRALLERHWQLQLSQWGDNYKECMMGEFVRWIGKDDHSSSDLHSFLGIIEVQLNPPAPFGLVAKYGAYLDKVRSNIRHIINTRSAVIMSPMSVEDFEKELDKFWLDRDNPYVLDNFMTIIKDRCKDACQIYLYCMSIKKTIARLDSGISPKYLIFLQFVDSYLKTLMQKYLQKPGEKETMFKTRNSGLNEKKIQNVAFLGERYQAAISELKDISDNAKDYVSAALIFIGQEIIEIDRSGTEELISRIKAVPDYRNNPTYDIAMDILGEWVKWCETPWSTPWGMGAGEVQGPEMTKNSIKKALQSFGTGSTKPCARKDAKPEFACLDTGGSSWTSWSVMGPVIRISSLRNNPNGSYTRKSVSVGSTVKICDGEERFWVKVIKIEDGRYYGRISNNLICDNGYDCGDVVVFDLEKIWDIEDTAPKQDLKEKPKSDGIFKPGDRVCFIKQEIYKEDGPNILNCFLGVVTDWQASNYAGSERSSNSSDTRCSVANMFNVLPMETLDLSVYDEDDVSELIEDKNFSKALTKSDVKSIVGNITLCPVDEEHFPKLNEILAKVLG